MNFCPDCGNTLTPDSNYCTKCGKLLMKLEKYESHISFSERDIFFCEICGTEIKQRYCPQCGNAIEKTEVKSALLPNPLRSGSLLSNIELNTDTLLPKKH